MENNMQIFNYNSNQVRTVQINGEPWFVLKDVCKILGIADHKVTARRLDEDEVSQIPLIDSIGRKQPTTIVNESGLYNTVIRSDKEEAKPFRKWVTKEVLPSIRKNGIYATDDFIKKALNNPDFVISTLQAYKEERQMRKELEQKVEVQTKQIEIMEPKATYYDKILNSKGLVSATEIAKDYGFGAVTLNKILNKKKVQYKVNGTWVLYEKYQDKGYVGTKTRSFSSSEGYDWSKESTYWTQKGRMFIYDLLKKDGMIPVMEREENL